ncbi:MAG: hypothetical protein A2W33_07090 [Chloroflexi bacterium RBG_16_52_11]|nr:MAG: hypothetical protein A2W33_07090 [Chloroflexi bacterium RBG_16_52_11]
MLRLLLSANTDWYLYNYRLSLAEAAQRQGFEVTLVSPPGQYVDELQQRGFRWLRWDVERQRTNPLAELPSLWNIAAIYRRERPDLVHHHTAKPVLYGSLAARILGKPAMVNSITGLGYIYQTQSNSARLLRRVVEPLLRLALAAPSGAVIFENEADRQYFLSRGMVSESHTWLIPGVGVDPERFTSEPEPPEPVVILLAGRMLWDKGVGVLIAAARLLRHHSEARVVLVGTPDQGNPAAIDETILTQWNQEGIIEWWGWRADMPSVYKQAHIVVLPTVYGEGVPTVLLEAAACGKPLVASDIPGCRYVIQEGVNGFLVPPNDPQALADTLERLVRHPQLRRKMGASSRQIVLEKFTHEQINTATLEVYRRVLNPDLTNLDPRAET